MTIQEVLETEWGSVPRSDNEQENLLAVIREWRTILLLDSDWTQTLDSPFTESERQQWAQYRQELRDIVETNSANLAETIFPTPPEGA
jgi:hypothetical protein